MHDSDQHDQVLRQCSYELSKLNEIARTLNASVDLSTLLDQALKKVAGLLDLKTGWILLFDEKTGQPYTAATLNLPAGFRSQPERMNGWCYCLEKFKSGNLTDAANIGVVKCSRLHALSLSRGDTADLHYHASIPLIAHEENHDNAALRLGMLNVATSQWRGLTDNDLGFLYTIGEMLSVAIQRARLHARRVESAQIEERLRLAREIHDTIAQNFSAIAFQLEAAGVQLNRNEVRSEEIRKNIDASLDLAHKGLDELRRSVFNLRAAPLEGRTLQEAITSLINEYNAKENITIEFKSEPSGDENSLPAPVETGLFRVVQEAIHNVYRHADASVVSIQLKLSEKDVSLSVEDNGKGFDFNEISEITGSGKFGLVGIRERVRLLGGTFRIESAPGTGTCIYVHVPLTQSHYYKLPMKRK
jgi:two-component system, NarL family, sensor kinase